MPTVRYICTGPKQVACVNALALNEILNAKHIAVHGPKDLFDAFATFTSADIAAYNAAHPTMPISFATVGKGDAIYTPACYVFVNEKSLKMEI